MGAILNQAVLVGQPFWLPCTRMLCGMGSIDIRLGDFLALLTRQALAVAPLTRSLVGALTPKVLLKTDLCLLCLG